jgi:hypothetical protein
LFCAFSLLSLEISSAQVEHIGKQIFQNECGGSPQKLTHWNQKEEFASFGIGHFIWYPANEPQKFEQTFVKMVAFLNEEGSPIPSGIKNIEFCPWSNREAFYADFNSPQMCELREWLYASRASQARFMANRLMDHLPLIVASVASDQKEHIELQIQKILQEPNGYYAFIDYLNFKGDGLSEKERYQGEGWGLKQVLLHMRSSYSHSALEEFVRSAKETLSKRVEHSPPERNEQRWLAGWLNRLDTYLEDKSKS